MNKSAAKGFTLIELLIVIGILAVLATVTLLVLNPAQMFAQARDSQRISDLNTVKSAISLYLSIDSTPSVGTNCGTNFWGTFGTTTGAAVLGNETRTFAYADNTIGTTTIGTSGWVPVDLAHMSGGSPISALPLDPSNISNGTNTNAATAYYYACSSTEATFKLVGNMESVRYGRGGPDDKESTDGGVTDWLYETGTHVSAGL